MSLRMSPRRSLEARWLRTMPSSTSSVVTPRGASTSARASASASAGALSRLSTVSRGSGGGEASSNGASAGVMIDSSSAPPLSDGPLLTVFVVDFSPLPRGISHHIQWRGPAGPQFERRGRLPDEHLKAADHGGAACPRLPEQVGVAAGVHNIDYDLPRRNSIGQRRRDFTYAVHSQRRRVDQQTLRGHAGGGQFRQRQPAAGGTRDGRGRERREALGRRGRAVDHGEIDAQPRQRQRRRSRRSSGPEKKTRGAAQRVAADVDQGVVDACDVGVVAEQLAEAVNTIVVDGGELL